MSWMKKTLKKVRGKTKKKKVSADEKTAHDGHKILRPRRKSDVLNAALAASDDWQAVGQRKWDLIEGQKKFNESEIAAFKTRPSIAAAARRRKNDELFKERAADKYKLN